MYIGQVAALTGISKKAIRHYEALGLLPSVQRRGSYRSYRDTEVTMLLLIKHAQSLGFRLGELVPLMQELRDRTPGAIEISHRLVEEKSAALQENIERLQAQLAELSKLRRELDQMLESAFGLSRG